MIMFYSFITSHIKSNDWLLGLSVKSCHCITNLSKKQTLLSFWKKSQMNKTVKPTTPPAGPDKMALDP